MNMAATPLRIPPPAACAGPKRNLPEAAEEEKRRSSRQRAVLLLPMAQLLIKRKRYHFCRLAAADRGAWTAAGASEHRTKKPPRSRKDIYIGAQTETQVTVAADPQRQGQRVFMGGTRAQSRPMAGRTKKSRIAPHRSRRHKPCVQMGAAAPYPTETFSTGSSHQRADDEQLAQIGAEGPLGGGT